MQLMQASLRVTAVTAGLPIRFYLQVQKFNPDVVELISAIHKQYKDSWKHLACQKKTKKLLMHIND